MKRIILLIVIYIAFISLGLPDSLLGVAWPSMRISLNLPLEAAGTFIMISTLCTAISSFISGHVISRLGTGRVTFLSCVITGSMLLAYSFAPSYPWLLLFTIPLGFGAGAVDTGLNNYVAAHFSSRHMSWLHCFWGVGASVGPNIMMLAIDRKNSWQIGYRITGMIQLSLAVILLASLPLWKLNGKGAERSGNPRSNAINVLRSKGVLLSVIAFPLYIGIEAGTGAWLGSLLVEGRNIDKVTAGVWVSMFYVSITAGRFLTGFITAGISNRRLIRGGILLSMAGAVILALPFKALILPGVICTGLGCAPIFPCMVHETPRRFGKDQSEIITGYQVGMAYFAGVSIIPLIGLLAGRISLEIIPYCVLLFAMLTLVVTERLNRIT